MYFISPSRQQRNIVTSMYYLKTHHHLIPQFQRNFLPHNLRHHDEVAVLMFKNLTRGESETQGPNVPKSDLDQAETQEPLQIEKLVSSG